RRHGLMNLRRARITSLRDDVHAEIAIGHDADHLAALLVLDDRNHARVLVTHDLRGALRGVRWYATRRVFRHEVLDPHDRTPPSAFTSGDTSVLVEESGDRTREAWAPTRAAAGSIPRFSDYRVNLLCGRSCACSGTRDDLTCD